jgi:N-acetyl-gamma-glutamyl-phosphate reductase
MEKIKVGILGGSGYGGSELLRILLFHPYAELCLVTANEHAGKRIDQVHPNLRQLTDLVFRETVVSDQLRELDCLFLALPHGESLKLVPKLSEPVKVIDLAGDFRINDAGVFQQYYDHPHTAMDLQQQFVYGLTEINRRRIASSRCIANPGCFATATLIGLYPLIASQLTHGRIIVDAKTGSSGSGAKPAANTHHPKRTNSFFAYKAFAHQHLPEVVQTLRAVNPEWQDGLIFQTHSAPMVRGIFASIYCTLRSPFTSEQIGEVFNRYYHDCFFVRLVEGSPDVNWVKNTNFADVGWAVNGTDLIVFVAIDNLVKGAAGQAVQNMNLMFGLEEQTGLVFPGSHP